VCVSVLAALAPAGAAWSAPPTLPPPPPPAPPENILFTKGSCLKLADFGLAIDLREERAVTRAGTLDYMAPGGRRGKGVLEPGLGVGCGSGRLGAQPGAASAAGRARTG
jgi:hypothetical protein